MAIVTSLHRVLIVGVGSIGERHLRCFQATGRASLSFCETNADLRRRIADRYAVDRVFADIDAALRDPPDAAVIATTAPSHIPIATKLAAASVHLLIEKPLSTSLDGMNELQNLVCRNRLAVAVAYVLRANPVFLAMKEALDSGKFGRPLHLTAVCGSHFPTYRPAYRDIYYNNRATGGGAVQDALTHILNAGEWFVGPIDRLMADAAHLALDGVQVEDTVNVLARHGGVLGCYSLNQHQAPYETSITVVCERGTCRLEAHENRWRWMSQPSSEWTDETFPPLERDSLYIRQAHKFLDLIEGAGPQFCSLDEGMQTLKVNLAALASIDQGGWRTITSNHAAESPFKGIFHAGSIQDRSTTV
jgi:predicted dehydrogenase